jgi:hypothetical protein
MYPKVGWEVVDWIHVGQDRDRWRALANTAVNLRVLLKVRNFVTSSHSAQDSVPWI